MRAPSDDLGGLSATFSLPEEALESLATAIGARLLLRLGSEIGEPRGSPWPCGAAAAAEYLGWPTARVYNHVRE